jgi:hypothetical protein
VATVVAGLSLTEQQERFCLEYAKSGNASASYRIAYPKSKAKPETINAMASALAARHEISIRISELRALTVKQTDMDLKRWAQEVTRLATADARKLMHPDGKMKLPHELDDDTAAAIASFRFDIDGTIEYKFHSKVSSLDMMARHKGAYKEDNAQRGGLFDSLPREVLKELAERMRRMMGERVIDGEVKAMEIRND